jgi:hypothetical protein
LTLSCGGQEQRRQCLRCLMQSMASRWGDGVGRDS